jgi:hypothetical protein
MTKDTEHGPDTPAQIRRKAGRPKGSKTKFNSNVLEAFECAYARLGGIDHLVRWGRKYPSEFYRLFGKRIPAAVEVDAKVQGNVTVEIVQFSAAPEGQARGAEPEAAGAATAAPGAPGKAGGDRRGSSPVALCDALRAP